MALASLVIAGTHSGAGKTSISLALTRALARRGFTVQTFKTGPDFLDPTYLALASGRPCHNLDGWMAGKEGVCRLFAQAADDADVALVEGVMGLFDGADADGDAGSTAEIARWLDVPILLVVNVHGMGRSLAALVQGFVNFSPDLRFAGVIANHCGSERHAAWLADALKAANLPPLVAAIPRGAFPELPSRHLGLVTADRQLLSEERLDALAEALERHCAVLDLLPPGLAPQRAGIGSVASAGIEAESGIGAAFEPETGSITESESFVLPSPAAPSSEPLQALLPLDLGDGPLPRTPAEDGWRAPEQVSLFAEAAAVEPSPGPCPSRQDVAESAGSMVPAPPETAAHRTSVPSGRLKIGVALDGAFHFYYPALFTSLAEAGAEAVFFSPLADRRLPAGIGALYLGGGYPEAHAESLAANGAMLDEIRAWALAGRPLYAECGGLMYLSQGLTALDGRFHPFLGILPARTRMLPQKKALGYVEVTLMADSLWGRAGDRFRGHEFHYSELTGDPVAADPGWQRSYSLRRRRSTVDESEGFQKGSVLVSYAHLYYATQPAAIARFLSHCGGRP